MFLQEKWSKQENQVKSISTFDFIQGVEDNYIISRKTKRQNKTEVKTI